MPAPSKAPTRPVRGGLPLVADSGARQGCASEGPPRRGSLSVSGSPSFARQPAFSPPPPARAPTPPLTSSFPLFSPPARRLSKNGVTVSVKKQPSVVMLTALHDKPCKYANGDYLNLLSVLNKQDYARLHNYPLVVASRLADPTLHNMWNKVGWILKTFEDYPTADWFFWVDSDTMVIDVNFVLPWNRFKGKDLVIWGNETRLALGDGRRGINSGVMLIRNSAWAKDFFEQVAELGRIAEPGLENVLMEELTSPEYKVREGGKRERGRRAGARARNCPAPARG